ncbi:MAG: DNA replication/repair protein RecF [Actinomycetes bacterium]
MDLVRLWLTDFRCYEGLELEFPSGCTVITGANGQGKTSLLEAVEWIATGRSFRGVPDAALTRAGTDAAIVRAEVERAGGHIRVEAEIRASGRNRILVNGQALARRRDLVDGLRATVFSPEDLELIKGGPTMRRGFLDDLLAASAPRYEALRSDYERVLRQRNALLKGGLRDADALPTLEVFDAQLARAGAELIRARLRLTDRLLPAVARAYADLAAEDPAVGGAYVVEWTEAPLTDDRDHLETLLLDALGTHRRREVDRGVTLVGPHRDEWRLELHGLEARTTASQGEQRCLALALRLGGHRVVAEVLGEEPILLLDDVFSELDPARSAALLEHLPVGQTLLTTAGLLPDGVRADRWLRVTEGRVVEGR